MEIDNSNFEDDVNGSLIRKSYPSIHFTLDPKVHMTGAAAKGLNAVIYAMQRQARHLTDNISDYHAHLGKGITVVEMKMTEFSKLIGINSRNYVAFKKTILEMGDIKATYGSAPGSQVSKFGFHNVFVSADVKDNTIEFIIPPASRELFISEKNVAVIDFVKVAENLSSKYSIFLHDLLEEAMYKSRKLKDKITLSFDNEVFRNALKVPFTLKNGVKQYSYHYPSKFIDKVLKLAVSEYNQATLKYHILDYRHDKGKIWQLDVIPLAQTYLRNIEVERPDDLHSLMLSLKAFGFNELNRNEYLHSIQNNKDFEYLLYLVDLTDERSRKSKGNKAGFFRTIFKNNKETYAKIWEATCKEREIESAAKRKLELDSIAAQKENHRVTYIQNKIDSFLNKTYNDEALLDTFMETVIEHLNSIKHPLARKYKAKIESSNLPDKNDPVVRVVAQQNILITKEEISTYVENQPIQIKV